MAEMTQPKSFWERREGVTGMVIPVLAGVAAIASFIFFGNWVAPLLITAFKNVLTMTLFGAATIAVLFVLFDPRLRNLLLYAYASGMRFLTSWFISVDPLGICEEYIDDLKDKLRNIRKQIDKLKGQMVNLTREIGTNKRKMEDNFGMAQHVKKKEATGKASSKSMMHANLKMREAGRLKKSNVTLKDLLIKLEMLYRNLCRTEEAAEFLVRDTESELDLQKRQRKAINAASSAINSARKIISGDDYKKIMYDQAMDFMLEDIGNKVGEMERFMEVSENFMEGVDLQNGQFEEEGWALLEEWEDEDSSLLGTEKQAIIKQSNDDEQVLDLENPIQKKNPNDVQNQFSNLFN